MGLSRWMYGKRQLFNDLQPNSDANNDDSTDVVFSFLWCDGTGHKGGYVFNEKTGDERLLKIRTRLDKSRRPEHGNPWCLRGSPHCRSALQKRSKRYNLCTFFHSNHHHFPQKWSNKNENCYMVKKNHGMFPRAPPSQAVANDSGFQWLRGWGRSAWRFRRSWRLPRWINYGNYGSLWLTLFKHGLYGDIWG